MKHIETRTHRICISAKRSRVKRESVDLTRELHIWDSIRCPSTLISRVAGAVAVSRIRKLRAGIIRREFTVAAYWAILGVRERPSKQEAKMEARTYGN